MWKKGRGSRVFGGLGGVVGINGLLFAKKMNFFNLFLASYRLLCYYSGFSGEYSSISQEYPPVN
jgi:hypothetical protein